MMQCKFTTGSEVLSKQKQRKYFKEEEKITNPISFLGTYDRNKGNIMLVTKPQTFLRLDIRLDVGLRWSMLKASQPYKK